MGTKNGGPTLRGPRKENGLKKFNPCNGNKHATYLLTNLPSDLQETSDVTSKLTTPTKSIGLQRTPTNYGTATELLTFMVQEDKIKTSRTNRV